MITVKDFELRINKDSKCLELFYKPGGRPIATLPISVNELPEHCEPRFIINIDADLNGYLTIINMIDGAIIWKGALKLNVDTSYLVQVLIDTLLKDYSNIARKL